MRPIKRTERISHFCKIHQWNTLNTLDHDNTSPLRGRVPTARKVLRGVPISFKVLPPKALPLLVRRVPKTLPRRRDLPPRTRPSRPSPEVLPPGDHDTQELVTKPYFCAEPYPAQKPSRPSRKPRLLKQRPPGLAALDHTECEIRIVRFHSSTRP
jgi:hypothetical protein